MARPKSPPVPWPTYPTAAPPAASRTPLATSFNVPSPPTAMTRERPSKTASRAILVQCSRCSLKAKSIGPRLRSSTARTPLNVLPARPPPARGFTMTIGPILRRLRNSADRLVRWPHHSASAQILDRIVQGDVGVARAKSELRPCLGRVQIPEKLSHLSGHWIDARSDSNP